MSRSKRALLICATFLVIVAYVGLSKDRGHIDDVQTTVNSITAAPQFFRKEPAEIDQNVFEPYNQAEWPKALAAWGEARFAQIAAVRVQAAHAASRNSSCDKVELAELSPTRSRPPHEIVILVDCKNGIRLYFHEGDL